MYGGLFGDLPPAKRDGNPSESESAAASNKAQANNTGEAKAPTPGTRKINIVQEPKAVNPSSLVQTLGVAGTSMAFIPTHLNRKRNIARVQQQSLSSIRPTVSSADVSSIVFETKKAAKVAPVPAADFVACWKEEGQYVGMSIEKTGPQLHIHGSTAASLSFKELSTMPTVSEPEELRLLHESVSDIYDPLVPNDLLQYWESQAAIQERKEIENEARETMQAQMRMQQQLELEQQDFHKSGDVDKLMELEKSNAMTGRGRGRGVSNLPAWLAERQRKRPKMK